MKSSVVYISITLIFLSCITYFGFQYYEKSVALKEVLSQYDYQDSFFSKKIDRLNTEKGNLEEALSYIQKDVLLLQNKVVELGGTVNFYEKLKSLDPQLLQKYSKVYFLNENYKPSKLSTIDPRYLFDKKKTIQAHDSMYAYLRNMLDSANSEGLNLLISSGYRSFETQTKLKTTYTVVYGATKANSFSADQGYSEHQLGTVFDFTTSKTGDLSVKFESTPEFKWLIENAHIHGFVLSYPKGNKYYVYEPWHWRFVGRDLATKLYSEKKNLYDLDQREIDGYLISIFN